MKGIYLILAILLSIFIINSFSFSAEEAVEFGNTICPISGEEIKEDEAVKYEYAGVVYNFCCKMCLRDFKKDPEKYIEKLKAQKEEAHPHGHTHEHHH